MPPDDTDIGLDVLADVPLDEGEVQKGKADSLLKVGSYTTDPENTMVRVDKSKGDGRPYARSFGIVRGPEEGRLGFAFSWERRNRVIDGFDTGKPDFLYRNYCRLFDLYTETMEAKPKKATDLVHFVQTVPLKLRVIQRQDGSDNMVVNISLVKDGA